MTWRPLETMALICLQPINMVAHPRLPTLLDLIKIGCIVAVTSAVVVVL